VNSSFKEYIVPFTGLKDGKHLFEFEIGDAFFADIEYSMIESGKVHVEMELDKNPNMLTTRFNLEGTVETTCDRCNDPMEVDIQGNFRLVFKFGNELSDNEELIVLPPEAHELELAPFLYEFITISLPARKVHPEGECNEEMVELISKYSVHYEDEEEYSDEEWDDEEE
jgi:uncharacterized protein